MERTVQRLAEEINELRKKDNLNQVETALAIGERILTARRLLKHGEWTRWRRYSIHFSAGTAENLMALVRFHVSQPDSFRKFASLGLKKLYRLSQLPERFLKRLRPTAHFRVPGASTSKTIAEMNPVEVNQCVAHWINAEKRRKPNQLAAIAARQAERLDGALRGLLSDMKGVRPEALRRMRHALAKLVGSCRKVLAGTSRSTQVA